MKSKKQIKALATAIISSSSKANVINQEILSRFISHLTKSTEAVAKRILSEIEAILSKREQENTLIIESAFKLDQEDLDKIKIYFEKKESKKLTVRFSINKFLIGGLKITLGDFVWEKSITTNLENLKGIIAYE